MLFALGNPVGFAGLLLAFLIALPLRAYAIRLTARTLGIVARSEPVRPRLRDDIDPFGAVAVAVGGAGWGKVLDVDEIPRHRGRGRAAMVFAAGPIANILVAQLFFLAFALVSQDMFVYGVSVGSVLTGQAEGDLVPVLLLSLACGLLGFGLLALLPIPPLDGFGLLWSAHRQHGAGMQGYRLWFQEKNIGIVILLAACFFPSLGIGFILVPLNALGLIFLRLWGIE